MIALSVKRDEQCSVSIFTLEYQNVRVIKPVNDEVDLTNPNILHRFVVDIMYAHQPLMYDCVGNKWTLFSELKEAALSLIGKDNHVFLLKTKPSENNKFGLSKLPSENHKLAFNKGGVVISGTKASGSSSKFWIDAPVQWYYGLNSNTALNEVYQSTEMPEVSKLPGLDELVVHPVLKTEHQLKKVIVNLNDIQRWTREQIADWLETLDVDLRFQVEK